MVIADKVDDICVPASYGRFRSSGVHLAAATILLSAEWPRLDMDKALEAASAHLRVMEGRIKKQEALISQLRKDGADTTEATRKLDLLLVALEEMQLQIARLTPSATDRAGAKKKPRA